MQDELGTPGVGMGDGSTEPIRPMNPLVRLGAPVVADLEPATPAALPENTDVEPAAAPASAADPQVDSSVLRRAALLRLVGLGRSRAMR